MVIRLYPKHPEGGHPPFTVTRKCKSMDIALLVIVFTSLLREGLTHASNIFMTSDEMDWTGAQSYCNERNGSLIVFDSSEEWENFTLSDMYQTNLKNGEFWLGHRFSPIVCDSSGKGCFKSTDSQWWCTTFPETCSDDDCIHVHQKDGKVHRKKCDDPNQVVCEKAAITNGISTSSAATTPTSSSASPFVTSEPSITAEISPVVTFGSSTTTEKMSTAKSRTSTIEISHPVTSTASDVTGVISPLTTSVQIPTTTSNKMTDEELLLAIQNLKSQLTVKKTNTSLYRRQFYSAYEARGSSVALGSFAIIFLVLVLCLITVPDIIIMVRVLSKRMAK